MHIAQKKPILWIGEKLYRFLLVFQIFIPLFPFYTQSNKKKLNFKILVELAEYILLHTMYIGIESNYKQKAFMNSVFSFFVYQFLFFFILCLTFSLFEHITFVSCYNSEKDYCYTNPLFFSSSFFFCVLSNISFLLIFDATRPWFSVKKNCMLRYIDE